MTDQSASPQSVGNFWSRSSLKPCPRTWKHKKDNKVTVSVALLKVNLPNYFPQRDDWLCGWRISGCYFPELLQGFWCSFPYILVAMLQQWRSTTYWAAFVKVQLACGGKCLFISVWYLGGHIWSTVSILRSPSIRVQMRWSGAEAQDTWGEADRAGFQLGGGKAKGRSCCLQLPNVWPCQRCTLKRQDVVDTNFSKGSSAAKFFPIWVVQPWDRYQVAGMILILGGSQNLNEIRCWAT